MSQMVFEMRLRVSFSCRCMSQLLFGVLAWDACETWVSRMVFAICWCVCSSRRCPGEKLNETRRFRNMGVTSGLCDVLDVLSVGALMEDLMR